MAVVRPVMFTSVDDLEVTFERPVSEETVRKMIQNANMLAALAPLGSVLHMQLNQPGVQPPLTSVYQLANGGEITEPTSPLRSIVPITRVVPDIRNRYVRGAPTLGTTGSGGSSTVNLSHTHSNGVACAPINANDGNERRSWNANFPCHDHTMNSDLSSAEPLDPAHQELAVYIKIN
jgi:hypothetical protein